MSERQTETTAPELPKDWWATADVLAYLESVGSPVARATWATYVSRGQAPAPERKVGRTPVWRPDVIRSWHESRRGQGWRGEQKPS